MDPQIQKFVSYNLTPEWRMMGRLARKTIHSIVDEIVDKMKYLSPNEKESVRNAYLLCYAKEKPVTIGIMSVLPQNYFSKIIKRKAA